MSITLKICEDEKEWDNLVEKSPHGTLFHTWKFLKIMEKHTPSKLYPLIGLKGTTPIGVYPLFYQKRLFLKMVFSPPPHCAVPYLGPLILEYDKLKQSKKESVFINFQGVVDDFISSELGAGYVNISTSPGLIDSRPLKWEGYEVEPMYTYTINLRLGLDNIKRSFKKELRRDIQSLENRGILVEKGSEKELKLIVDSTVHRYEEQGRYVTVSRAYLIDVYKNFYPESLKIFTGKDTQGFVGGSIKVCYKNRISSWVGSPKEKIGSLSVNDYIQWRAIKWGCENNFDTYEEMGANTERLRHFKSKYNPHIDLYFSAKKYLSPLAKLIEFGYSKILKPVLGKIK